MEQSSDEQLTHLIYEAALDNSLWPEMLLEITQQMEEASRLLDSRHQISFNKTSLFKHLKRALFLSDQILDHQEKTTYYKNILNGLSFGIALLDKNGKAIIHNDSIQDQDLISFESEGTLMAITGQRGSLKNWVKKANKDNKLLSLTPGMNSNLNGLVIPREYAISMGFPSIAKAVLIITSNSIDSAARQFYTDYGLTPRESELVLLLAKGKTLKDSAAQMGIHYESARSYLKCIFNKTNISSQVQLQQHISLHPAHFLKDKSVHESNLNKRNIHTFQHSHQIEYFQLGCSDGYPIFYFDALAGTAFDISGYPEKYINHLNKLNVQIINVCRPGTFGSSFRKMDSLSNFAEEITAISDSLNIHRFSILSYSYGSGSALGVAHQLGDRVDRMVMASPNYAKYTPENWREMDMFCQMTNFIGRKWPDLYRQLLHFYIRSVLQNWKQYIDRNISRTQCQDDVQYLSCPQICKRSAELLAQRTMNSMDGFVQENYLNSQGWDFALSDIDVPVMIFHGELDNVSPVGAARTLTDELPNASLFLLENLGHFFLYREWRWLISLCCGVDIRNLDDIPSYTEHNSAIENHPQLGIAT